MTKKVRVENADLSAHPVRVTVQDKVVGENGPEWRDVSITQLDHPTFMTELFIHSTRRLIVEELAANT